MFVKCLSEPDANIAKDLTYSHFPFIFSSVVLSLSLVLIGTIWLIGNLQSGLTDKHWLS